jgi:CRISPR/Cas system-associated endoribonuclease Cas2
MSTNEPTKYFDLHTQGLGYLNRIRDVTPKEGAPFLSVTLAALRGRVDNVQYTHFECRVSGKQAQDIVSRLKPAVEDSAKVLIGFTLSDLYAEAFTFKNGDKAGETGVSLKARLLRIAWAKVDGQPFYTAEEDAA